MKCNCTFKKLGVALGVVKGFVESRASHLSMPAHVLLEKVTDFSDFFSGALKMSEKEQEKFVETFLSTFLDNAKQRLGEAKNVSQITERLHDELELYLSLVDLTTEKSKLRLPPRFRRQTTRSALTVISKILERKNSSLEKRLERRRNKESHYSRVVPKNAPPQS